MGTPRFKSSVINGVLLRRMASNISSPPPRSCMVNPSSPSKVSWSRRFLNLERLASTIIIDLSSSMISVGARCGISSHVMMLRGLYGGGGGITFKG